MDPLSIGASALTVAEVLVGALKTIQIVRKAPAEVQSLINDVSDLQAVISEVTTALPMATLLEPDVEALLFRRLRDDTEAECFLVPISKVSRPVAVLVQTTQELHRCLSRFEETPYDDVTGISNGRNVLQQP